MEVSTGRKVLDVALMGVCIATVLSVAIAMFSTMGSTWFSWHPVLMTCAFPCMMTMGRWSYKADPSWGRGDKASRRSIHAIIMASATVIALVGYLCIFMAHLPKQSFFGYNFETHEWNADKRRVAHSILGYVVLLAVLAQASMGLSKNKSQSLGVKTMRFHGTLGKVVMFGGAINMLLAILFWDWSTMTKVRLIAFLAFLMIFATVLPLPQDAMHRFGCPAWLVEAPAEPADDESQSLVEKSKQ